MANFTPMTNDDWMFRGPVNATKVDSGQQSSLEAGSKVTKVGENGSETIFRCNGLKSLVSG
jgi:hypothetical protein